MTHTTSPLLRAVARHWWLVLLRGIAAIAFGILAIAWPGVTLLTLIVLYGAYALADGVARHGVCPGRSPRVVRRWPD